MKLQYVRAFIVLLAGLIALIINMKTGRSVIVSLFIVLIVILIFYVIGTLVVEILQKALEESNHNESDSENSEMDSENTEQDENEEEQDETATFSFEEDAE